MNWQIELLIVLLLVFFLLGIGHWIPFALAATGLVTLLLHSGTAPLRALGNLGWNTMNDFVLTAVPLFIFMGQLILHSGLSQRFYRALTGWLTNVPGGLLHSNIVACGIFSAVSGSSVATAAAIGTVSIPELSKRRYDSSMIYGSLAAGGTLGILLPPSIVAILYAAQTQQSVAKLFIAGVGPGLMMVALFMIYIAIRVAMVPALAPSVDGRVDWGEKLRGLLDIAPILGLVVPVLGGIYFGIMTPTEAAAVGTTCALVIGFVFGDLRLASIKECLKETVKTNCMILFIVLGAQIFSFSLVSSGLNRALTEWVLDLNLASLTLFLLIALLYIVLGMFIDGISMMLLTLPLLFPVVVAAGFDPIWFGIALTVLIEIGQITPPMGLNLFVIQGIAHDSLAKVAWGSAPYVVLMLVALGLMYAFPEIVLWLPARMN